MQSKNLEIGRIHFGRLKLNQGPRKSGAFAGTDCPPAAQEKAIAEAKALAEA
ncbi:hypothetical protein AALA80_02560 [Oscillospiraceae bacterium 50-60]